MSLIYCPECGHEVSEIAPTCPNCGHPFHPQPAVPRVVVTDRPVDDGGIPTWAIAALGVLGIVVVFGAIFVLTRSNEDENRVNVNMAAKRPNTTTSSRDTSTRTDVPATTAPSTTDTQTVNVPGSQATVNEPRSDRGSATIDAKVINRSGATQAVKGERFYLLDEDIESILNDADLEPIEGQTLMGSLGLAVMKPGQYGDFHRKAMAAIKNHIKYSTTTDAGGKGEIRDIAPDGYYLFGITKTGEGFAIWSSSVSIREGQNNLNLSPQRLEEISG